MIFLLKYAPKLYILMLAGRGHDDHSWNLHLCFNYLIACSASRVKKRGRVGPEESSRLRVRIESGPDGSSEALAREAATG
jgi:hypothetical protein